MSMNQNLNQKMVKLGELMKDISTWTWLSIFLFITVIPVIVLLIKLIMFVVTLEDVSSMLNDEDVKSANTMMIIALILNLTGIGALVSWILQLLAFKSLEKWAKRESEMKNSENMAMAASGFHTVYIGNILTLLLIGVFIMPGGFKKAGQGLISEYSIPVNYSQNQPSQIGYQQPMQPNSGDNYTFGQPIQTNPANNGSFGQPMQDQTPKFCRSCGAELQPGQKFCKQCGQPL